MLLTDTGQHLVQLAAKPLARGYLLHAGVPPSSTCSGSKRRLRPSIQFPRLVGRDLIEQGEEAPDFELPDQDGRPVRLSDFRGRRVVVYFYPKADTRGS